MNHENITQDMTPPSVDEAALIEDRRKKREAIKAKHRGQTTQALVQALALDIDTAPKTSDVETSAQGTHSIERLNTGVII